MLLAGKRAAPPAALVGLLMWVAGLFLGAATTRADSGAQARIEASTSFWWTIREEVENGLHQAGSLDPADDTASGFNFRQGRLGLIFAVPDSRIAGLLRIRLEERTDVIDFWGAYRAASWLSISIGQMKIPATAEVLAPDHRNDFISRTTFGRYLGDYALARTPYISSIMAAKSYQRDVGIALRGAVAPRSGSETPVLDYFLMIGNGFGGNRYVGGGQSSEFVYTNEFGEFYYGARLEVRPRQTIAIGAHGSLNRHTDIALDARGPVFDLDRRVATINCALDLPRGLRAGGFYGSGRMEDYWSRQAYRYDYSGWAGWLLANPIARLELALRYDVMTTEFHQNGNRTRQRNWTCGVNYRPEPALRLQLNYLAKETVDGFEPDLADNLLYLNVQFEFSADIAR